MSVELKIYNSIGELFLEVLRLHGHRDFIQWRGAVGESLALTFNEVHDLSSALAAGLAALGVEKDAHVAIFSETRAEWIYADLGILGLGGVVVTIYPSLTAKQAQYIVKDSESVVVFVDSHENLEKLLTVWPSLPNLEHVLVFDEITEKELVDMDAPLDKVHHVSWLVAHGKETTPGYKEAYAATVGAVQETDLASIIYTSGTTGVPKGVMLTHRNFLSDAIACSEILKKMNPDIQPHEQNSLTFMPLSHVFCRTAEEWVALYNGGCLCLAGGRSPAIIETGFKVFKPTLMAGIPYVFEKVYNRVFEKVKEMPSRLQGLFHKALAFGKKYNQKLARGEKIPLTWRLRHWLDEKLVYKRVRKELGGRLLGFVSGSAKLPTEIAETFWAIGLPILEGYGLTEASPVTHFSRDISNSAYRPDWPAEKEIHPIAKLGSCGPPINFPGNPYPPVEQKLGEGNELLVKGPMVMAGYWKKPDETKAVLEPDGWLHTGDVAQIDADGYMTITGRMKLIVKLSTGKMVAPAYVEEKVVLSPLVLQCVLVGSERKYLTAFVVPDQKGIKELAEEEGITYSSYEDLLRDARVMDALKREILARSKDLAAYETIKKFAVFAQEFNEEDGYLTPTLKFKRNRIVKDFAEVVDQLYEIEGDYLVVEARLVDFHDLTIPG